MTAKRSLKRRVRARAFKTGESYTAALRHVHTHASGDDMNDVVWVRVSKPEAGFSAAIPADWQEAPPELSSFSQLGQWLSTRPAVRGLALFRNPVVADQPRRVAEGAAGALRAAGHHVRGIADVDVAGLPGARLDTAGRPRWLPDITSAAWQLRQYFVIRAGEAFVLGLASSAGTDDDALFDAIAASVEWSEPAPRPTLEALQRYTDRARRVLYLAGEEAGDRPIGTEHLLVACAVEGEGVAAVVLAAAGVTAEQLRNSVQRLPAARADSVHAAAGYTSEAEQLIHDIVPAQALRLGHNYVGTEHILLGILTQTDTHGTQVLHTIGVDESDLRDRLAGVLTSYIAERIRTTS